MSNLHTVIFALCLIVVSGIVLVLSNASTPMLIYNESEIYSCPKDYMKMFSQYHDAAKSLNITSKVFGQVKAFNKSQDKRFKVEPFTGGRVE